MASKLREARRRMRRDERRQLILDAAVRIARRDGLRFVTHERVAEECYWPTSVTTVWRIVGDTGKLITATALHGEL